MGREVDIDAMARRVVAYHQPPRRHWDDCVQQAVLVGLQALRSAEKQGQEPAVRYLHLCMSKAVVRYLIAERQRGMEDIASSPEPQGGEDTYATAAENEWLSSRRQWLEDHLHLLPPKQRRTIEMLCFVGLSADDVADIEGLAGRQSVWERVYAAVTTLKRIAQEEGETSE